MRNAGMRIKGHFKAAALLLSAAMLAGCSADQAKLQDKVDDGQVALGGRRYDQAIEDADDALKISPTSAQAYYLRGRAEEERGTSDPTYQQSDLTKAAGDYRSALTLNPGEPIASRSHAGLANVSFKQNDFATALQEWALAVDHLDLPEWKANALYHIGLSQQCLGRFDDADQTFTRVMQQYPGSEVATKSQGNLGVRGFCVQVGAYSNPGDAQRALKTIASMGLEAMQVMNQGLLAVRCGPFSLYTQAIDTQTKLAPTYPDAIISTVQ